FAQRMLGVARMMNGDLPGAVAPLTRSIELAPEDARSYILLGNVEYRLEQFGDAEGHFLAAISADPMASEPYFNLAKLYTRMKRSAEAKKFYDEALTRGAVPDADLERLL